LEIKRRLLEIERHKAIWRMREEHLGSANAYRRLQSLLVEEDTAEEWDGNKDIWRKEKEIEGLKRRMEEMKPVAGSNCCFQRLVAAIVEAETP